MRRFLMALVSWMLAISFVNRVLAANCSSSLTANGTPSNQLFSSFTDIMEYLAPSETFIGGVSFLLDIIGSITLDNLKNITGDLVIANTYETINTTNTTSVSLGTLEHVGGDIYIGLDTITQLNLSSLVSVNGSLELNSDGGQALLRALQLPSLLSVRGDVSVIGFPGMTTIELPSLTSAGNLHINNLPVLSQVNFTNGLYISNSYSEYELNPTVYIDTTGLESIGNIFISNSTTVTITNNPTLNSVTLHGTASNSTGPGASNPVITITENSPNLTIAFPQLTAYMGDLIFDTAASLNIDDLVSVSGAIAIKGLMPTFSAPNLKIAQSLTLGTLLDSFRGVSNASLPLLETLNTLDIWGIPTPWSSSSLYIPEIKSIEAFMFFVDSASFCQYWKHQRCLGVIVDSFCCGSNCPSIPVLHSQAECDKKYPATGLTHRTKLSIGLGVGLGVPALALLVWCLYIWRKWWMKKKDSEIQPTVELAGLPDENHEPLPKYQRHETIEQDSELPGYDYATLNRADTHVGNSVARGS